MGILEQLSQSNAVSSLHAEQRIVRILHSLRWSVTHGLFFVDPTTQKPRELDISARRFWTNRVSRQKQYASIILKCEIKSAKDYHLVFSPRIDSGDYDHMRRVWLGYEEVRLSAELEKAGVPTETIHKVLERFQTISSYPSGIIRLHKLMIDAMPAPFYSTAFRETNVGGVKDLDTSVLWKAMQALNSALVSDQNKLLDIDFEDLRDNAQLAMRLKENVLKSITQMLSQDCQFVTLYHPVVVVESRLWYLAKKSLTPLKWCRFCQVGIEPFDQWCDVVSMDFASQYFHKLTDYYHFAMRKIGARGGLN